MINAILLQEKVDRAHVEVSYQGKVGGHLSGGVGDRATDEFVAGAVRAAALTALHPRTAVHVSVQQLEDDGGELAACANAACLALVDAGVAMRYNTNICHIPSISLTSHS